MYSADLPQGVVEAPCALIFRGDVKRTDKARRLLQFAMASKNDDANPCKKRKVEDLNDKSDSVPETNPETVRVKQGGITLYTIQKTKISAGDKLDDLVIKVAPKNPQEAVPKFG